MTTDLAAITCGHRGTWRNYDGTNGLPGPTVCVRQDRQGYLWLGTYKSGASRFDGEQFKTFGQDQGLAGDVVWDIHEDAQGDLWFGTDSGLSRFNGVSFQTYTQEHGLASGGVQSIVEDDDGNLWLGTEAGLSRFDGSEFATFSTADGLPCDQVDALLWADGQLWLGTEMGLSRFDGRARGANFVHYGTEDGLVHPQVAALAAEAGGLWIGTHDGLSYFDGERFLNYGTAEGLPNSQINDLTVDQDGVVWLGTMGGVSSWDGHRFCHFTTADGLANTQIHTVFQDNAGNFWFGGYVGLSQYSQSFFSLTTSTGLVHNDVRGITQDRQGRLWFATQGGVSLFEEGGLTSIAVEEGLVDNRVFCILEDAEGALWMGTEGGVSRYCNGVFRSLTTDDGLVNNRVYKMLQDRKGALWFGSEAGLSRYDGDGFVNYTTADGMVNDDVNAMIEDREGNLWIGTEGGVCRLRHGEIANLTTADGLPGNSVMGILEARDGRIWFATLNGASCFDGTGFTNYGIEQGMSSDTVLRLHEDSTGYLWFGTWAGVNRFDGEVFQTLTQEDGLSGSTVLSFYEDGEGSTWLGSNSGVTCFRPPPPSPPPIYVRAVVADKRYEDLEGLRLPASAGLTAFEFHGVNFKTRPGALVYGYRLRGHDDVMRITHQRRVEYQDLPAGKYTFQVTAVDRDLNYSVPANVEIEVVPDARDEIIDELEAAVRERTQELSQKNAALERALNQLHDTQNQLVVQEKMAALGNLVAGIVHELNSPLGTVKASGDVLARGIGKVREQVGEAFVEGPDGKRLGQTLHLLDDSVRATEAAIIRITGILDSLKSFARLDQAEYQETDIQEGLDSTLTLLEHQVKEEVRVERQYGDLPLIYAYPGELNQVFMNVLLNSSQAIDGSGVIRIKTYADEANVYVEISDTGRGIAKDKLERIFEPDFSNKDSRVGMGLGLATSYNIVRKHNGFLRLQSELGKGTAATIILPVDLSESRGT